MRLAAKVLHRHCAKFTFLRHRITILAINFVALERIAGRLQIYSDASSSGTDYSIH